MFHRFGYTNDWLGVGEPMRDLGPDNLGINVSAKFYLAFSKSKEEVFRMIETRHIMNQN